MDTPTKCDNRHISAVPAAAFLASVVADTASPPLPPPQRKPSNLLTFLFPGSQSQNNLKTSPSPSPPTASFFFPFSLSLSAAKIPPQVHCSIKPLHILQSNKNPLELTLSPDRCHTPPRQIRCEESRELRCNRSSYVRVRLLRSQLRKQARRSNTRCF
jgi:hypothetical protein